MLKEDVIEWILIQFEAMGATRDELRIERLKLLADTAYAADFLATCTDLADHHFHAAFEG